MELGIYSFVEYGRDPLTGETISPVQRMSNLMEEMELADQVGLDVFAIGEHHRPEFLASAPAVLLAAASQRTQSIRLSSAVTVLSSDDPVRVFQEFASLDLLSNGRAEIMAGRGSFIESFPLFGYALADYNELFEEKLELLLKLRTEEIVSWNGALRAPIDGLGVYPRPTQSPLPVWIAVGGTPASVVRAGALGLPLALAIIGGAPRRFRRLIGLYRETATSAGHPGEDLPVGINLHGFIADTSQSARDELYPAYFEVMNKIGRERGWPAVDRNGYEFDCSPEGALIVGSPQEVIDKLLALHELFGNTRFMIKLTLGVMPHAQVMRAIELYGSVVAPAVRKVARVLVTS